MSVENNLSILKKTVLPWVVSRISPEKLILYGPYATGEISFKSEIDLMIIKKNIGRTRDIITNLYSFLYELDINIPITFNSVDFDRFNSFIKETGNSFYKKIYNEGIVIYEEGKCKLDCKSLSKNFKTEKICKIRTKNDVFTETPVLNDIIPLIVSVVSPDKIILFGSRARGDYLSKSDIDLFIVKKDLTNPRELSKLIYVALGSQKIDYSIDIVSVDYDKYNKYIDKKVYFYKSVVEEGVVIYDRL